MPLHNVLSDWKSGNLIFETRAHRELFRFDAANNAIVINEGSADVDFRVETDGLSHAIYSDGAKNSLVFGANSDLSSADRLIRIGRPARTATADTSYADIWVEPAAAVTIPAGTAAVVATLYLVEPNITATGTVTSAATLYIASAPDEGGTNNNAIHVASGGVLLAGGLTIPDDALLGLGTGNTARFSYDTTDADANALLLQLPAGGAVDVPVLAIGQSIESVDLGLFTSVVDPTIAIFGIGGVTTGARLRVYKARGTVAVPLAINSGDDLFSISAYGYGGATGYIESARIALDSTGTIADTRVAGTISLQVATDAVPSVLTERVLITGSGAITLTAATDVVVANGTGLLVGNATGVTAGALSEFQVLGTAIADGSAILGLFVASAVGPDFQFVKGRAAAIGGLDIVSDNDEIGRIVWLPADGADLATEAAVFQAEVDDASPAAGDIGMAFVWESMAGGGAAIAERMRLTATGDLLVANNGGVVIGHTAQITAGALSEFQVLGTAIADGSAIMGLFAASALGPDLQFVKSRVATIGDFTIVQDNDEIGRLVWLPADGVDLATEAAVFQAEVDDASPAAGDIGMAFVWESMAGAGAAIAEKMRLSAAGHLTATGRLGLQGTAINTADAIVVNYLETAPAEAKRVANLTLQLTDTAAGNANVGVGVSATVTIDATNTQNWTSATAGMRAVSAVINIEGGAAGTVTGAANYVTSSDIGAGTITSLYGMLVQDPSGAGTVTNNYGVYVQDQTKGATLNYGVYIAGGNSAALYILSDPLQFGAANDIVIPAATAASLEISDGTTKFYAFDTRVATAGVTTHALDISDYTIASGAGNVETGLSLAAHTLNYTGNTQVTTQVDTVVLGARTIAGDTATLTVDEANTLLLVAPLEGANVAITAASALRIVNAGGTPVNQYGIYIEDLTVGATADYGIYIAGADTAAIMVASADPIRLGFGGAGTGKLEFAGTTSGVVTMTVADAAGTWTMVLPTGIAGVGGDQLTDAAGNGVTSWAAVASRREYKAIDNVLDSPADARDALDKILGTRTYAFHYDKEVGKGTQDYDTQYVGIMADEAPWAMHYKGNVLNPINTFGYTVLAFQAMETEIQALRSELAALKSK